MRVFQLRRRTTAGVRRASAAALLTLSLCIVMPARAHATNAQTWTASPQASQPPPEDSTPYAVDDPATGQLVLYHPVVSARGCAVAQANSTWLWDGGTWTPAPNGTRPSGRTDPTLVYDAATRQVLMFGGSPSENCATAASTYLADTWSWNGDSWTQLSPAASPPAGDRACAAYDAATREVVLFGDETGVSGGRVADPNTWIWNGTTWSPHLPMPSPPATTFSCAMTYDAARSKVVLQSESDLGVSTWEWDGAAWSERATGGPELNGGARTAIAYDAHAGRTFLYNGSTSCFPPGTFGFGDCTKSASETWAWDGTSWQQVAGTAEPPSRGVAAFAYDSTTQQIVLFGGYSRAGDLLADTWVYASGGSSSVIPARLAGNDRDMTAVAASREEFPAGQAASAVVLARGDQFADALTGGPLAAAKKAPLLLTSSGSLDASTGAEISRVLPPRGTVYLLGGTSALSAAVEQQVMALGFTVERIAGSDRYSTAVAVAGALGNPTTVLEASGTNFADALSAGPAAASADAAILLTAGGLQSAATSTYLAAHPGVRYAIGGPAANADPTATALVGTDRYATSAQVARAFFPAATSFGVATGTGFADALSGGALSATRNQPILLVPGTNVLPEPVGAFISTHAAAIAAVQVFGGTAAVSDEVVSSVSGALAGG